MVFTRFDQLLFLWFELMNTGICDLKSKLIYLKLYVVIYTYCMNKYELYVVISMYCMTKYELYVVIYMYCMTKYDSLYILILLTERKHLYLKYLL